MPGLAHQPRWLKSKGRRTLGRPVRGPKDDAQRGDLRMPNARTRRRPAQGPHDAQREDPTTLSRRTHAFTTCHPSGLGVHLIYGAGTLTKLLTLTLMPGCLDSAWSRDCRHELASVGVHPGRCLAGTRDGIAKMVKGQSSKWMSESSPLSTLPIDVADFSLQGHRFSILKTGSADL
ncbi:hypothetical protein U0070_006478 [Myodes glareolus]|uniref:Uncharacterized protein n=1 Tax=Myodes glareolus TaxID=447135 RepID=A0AAW0HSP2_MYOGA